MRCRTPWVSPASMMEESWNSWLTKWLHGWRGRMGLAFRCKSQARSMGHEENLRRLGALWRNCTRITAHFYPSRVEWDGWDHTPTTRRMAVGKQLATKGGDAHVGGMEDHKCDHDRHTTDLFSSSDGKNFDPVMCLKGVAEDRMQDIDLLKIPKGLLL